MDIHSVGSWSGQLLIESLTGRYISITGGAAVLISGIKQSANTVARARGLDNTLDSHAT